jgi:hypothetical protein
MKFCFDSSSQIKRSTKECFVPSNTKNCGWSQHGICCSFSDWQLQQTIKKAAQCAAFLLSVAEIEIT